MKSKKVLVAFIIILVILIICGGAFAYIFYQTDLLKTNAQLFSKYGKEAINDIAEFFYDENINAYYEKKLSSNSENDGNVNIKVQINNDDEDVTLNDTALTFNGATDVYNKKAEQNIDLNYSNNEKFSFAYVRNNDLYALASDEIVNKYIAVDNNNLKELANKLGVEDTADIPDRINLEEYQSKLNKEEIESLQNKYMSIITNQLVEEDFSKKEGKENAYVLTIRDEKLKVILTNIINELKNEAFVLDTLESQDEIKEYQDNIDTLTEELKNEDFSDASIQITVEKAENGIANIQLSMISQSESMTLDITKSNEANITINVKYESNSSSLYDEDENTTSQEFTIELSKTATTDGCKYNLSGEIEDSKISYSIELTGLSTNSVTEKYIIEYTQDDDTNFALEYNNKIKFKDNVETTDLDEDNTVILNDYNDADELQNLIQQIGEQIIKVNGEKINRAMEDADSTKKYGLIVYVIKQQQGIIEKAQQAQQNNLEKIQQETELMNEQLREFDNYLNTESYE